MAAHNSTLGLADPSVQELSCEMCVDTSIIEKDSPPQYVTHRRGADSGSIMDLRAEMKADLKAFESSLSSMLNIGFSKQEARLAQFTDDFNDIKTSIKFIGDKYDDLKSKHDDMATRVTKLESETKETQKNTSCIADLGARLDMMEQQARQCNLEVCNLPEKRGENLMALFLDITAAVKEPVIKSDIVAIHRVPQATAAGNRPKNIIVRLATRQMRDSVVSAVRLHKGITSEQLGITGSSHRIYINEHLTLKNKDIFRRAREAAKQHGFRFVWIKHGVILARRNETSPVFAVRFEADLAKFNIPAK